MAYQSPHGTFIFEGYAFNDETATAEFRYSFDGQRHFTERLVIPVPSKKSYDKATFERAMQLAFYLVGTSYYKAFPTKKIIFKEAQPDKWQATFLNKVYTHGLSQFMFENNLEISDMAQFSGTDGQLSSVEYQGGGILTLQSGGKDSLLLASLLESHNVAYTPWYVGSSDTHPLVLDSLSDNLQTAKRHIDVQALHQATVDGGLNGHVPVTYIVLSFALIQAILTGKSTVLASIGAEGEEPHEYIATLPVNHQWSKTWQAEQLLAQYVKNYISSNLRIGSPLRGFSELRIAELFVKHAWNRFGNTFSSCNRLNYTQGAQNQTLHWCGDCPKCANSYLLFAPFVAPHELQSLFANQDLFVKPTLAETFKGLLAIDGVMKPFECVGETDELRVAYHMARERYGAEAYQLPFEVPQANFDYLAIRPSQEWVAELGLNV